MGYIRHHSIIVSSWSDKYISLANNKAKEIFGHLVSDIINSNINGCRSFFIAPDGSKEGWPESNTGNDNRDEFIIWIKSRSHSDGSNSIRYAELFFSDDEGEANIIRHN